MVLTDSHDRASLETLSNEILLHIIDEIYANGKNAVRWGNYPRQGTIKSLSMTSKRLRVLCLPKMFQDRSMRWSTPESMAVFLQRIGNTDSIGLSVFGTLVRGVEIRGEIKDKTDATKVQWSTNLAKSLKMMPKLNTIKLDQEFTVGMQAVLRQHLPKLNAVTQLEVSSTCPTLILACPNTKILVVDIRGSAIVPAMKAAAKLSALETLVLRKTPWTINNVQLVTKHAPDIINLMMLGELDSIKRSILAATFSSLKHLQYLALTDWQEIFIDTDEYLDDEDGYDEACDEAQNYHPCNEPDIPVARAFFRACPELIGFSNCSQYSHRDDKFENTWFTKFPDIVADREKQLLNAYTGAKHDIEKVKIYSWCSGDRDGEDYENRTAKVYAL